MRAGGPKEREDSGEVWRQINGTGFYETPHGETKDLSPSLPNQARTEIRFRTENIIRLGDKKGRMTKHIHPQKEGVKPAEKVHGTPSSTVHRRVGGTQITTEGREGIALRGGRAGKEEEPSVGVRA